MKSNKNLLSLSVAAILSGVSLTASAAGFQLAEYSATGLGRAYAGEAAIADNASAQWRNPALLTELKGTQISLGAVYVDPNVDVDGTVNYYGNESRTQSHDYARDAVVPNLYLSHQLNDRWVAGLAFGTNYGMETKLSDDFGASHFGNEAKIITKEANANLGYKLTDYVSVGAGVRYVQGEGHFGATTPENNALHAPQGYTLKYMEGDDHAWGWQAGANWQINEKHCVAFAYKSEVSLKLQGHAEGAGFGLAAGEKLNGYMHLPLPATAELATHHQLSDKLALHTSINWTDWSQFNKLEASLERM